MTSSPWRSPEPPKSPLRVTRSTPRRPPQRTLSRTPMVPSQPPVQNSAHANWRNRLPIALTFYAIASTSHPKGPLGDSTTTTKKKTSAPQRTAKYESVQLRTPIRTHGRKKESSQQRKKLTRIWPNRAEVVVNQRNLEWGRRRRRRSRRTTSYQPRSWTRAGWRFLLPRASFFFGFSIRAFYWSEMKEDRQGVGSPRGRFELNRLRLLMESNELWRGLPGVQK